MSRVPLIITYAVETNKRVHHSDSSFPHNPLLSSGSDKPKLFYVAATENDPKVIVQVARKIKTL
jgi:hypothetical protein